MLLDELRMQDGEEGDPTSPETPEEPVKPGEPDTDAGEPNEEGTPPAE